MNNITRNNYEEYILDYLEGALSEELRLAMQQFLQQNADIQQEINDFVPLSLTADETIQMPNKANLLCDLVRLDNYEEYAIDYVEQTLDANTRAAMDMFLANQPQLKDELHNFRLVTVPVDNTIVYVHKEKLKKQAGKMGALVSFWSNPMLRYAAAVAALFVLWVPLSNIVDMHQITSALYETSVPNKPTQSMEQTPTHLPNSNTNNNNLAIANLADKGTDSTPKNLQHTQQQINNLPLAQTKKVKKATANANYGFGVDKNAVSNNLAAQNSQAMQPTATQHPPIASDQKHSVPQNTTNTPAQIPATLASIEAKKVFDNTVINYIISPKSASNTDLLYANTKPNLLKRFENQTDNAEKLFAQNVLSKLPSGLLPEAISDGLSRRRQSVSVEVPIQPETHQRLKNFLGNK